MAGAKKKGLGRGLDALFKDMEINVSGAEIEDPITGEESEKQPTEDSVLRIDINDIRPNSEQPRKVFDPEKIKELADSILEHGLIQPIVVRLVPEGQGEGSRKIYEIVTGERRWRAAREAGLKTIPAIVRELSERQNMLLAIIENTQREDLNPIEEAEAVARLSREYGLTQEQLAKSLGKSRPYVANSMRLLNLPEDLQKYVASGHLSAGHARALLAVNDPEKQRQLAEKAMMQCLSVRELEDMAVSENSSEKKKRSHEKSKRPEVVHIEQELKELFGTRVNLKQRGDKGKIEIEFYSKDELERLLELLQNLSK